MESLVTNLSWAMKVDPVQLARVAGITPDPWQERLLRSQSSRLLLNCSRQVGKSTITGVLSVHTALYNPGSTILLLSPSLRQSGELLKKCLEIYRAAEKPVSSEAETALRLELENGSRIVSLPGKEGTIRGFSAVDLLIIDEASRVDDALYYSILPMLAVSKGRLALLSTPFACTGFFYEAWRKREDWQYFEVSAYDCPRISNEFLEEQKERMGDWWFRMEFLCQFNDSQSSAFRTEDIQRIVSPEVEQWAF